MIMKQFKINNSLFASTLILSTLFLLTSSNWINMWVMLEMNLMSFIPMMMLNEKNYEMETAIKYFLVQAASSSIMLLSIILYISTTMNYISSWMFLFSITMKMGAAPSHYWLPPIYSNTSWKNLFILSTWQKIPPLLMLSLMTSLWNIMMITLLIALNGIIGALGGMNQTQLRPLLAYSSIAHMSWLLASMLLSNSTTFIYFLLYTMTMAILTYTVNFSKNNYTNNLSNSITNNSSLTKWVNLHFLSLVGLPPLPGFFPKWFIIQSLFWSQPLIPILLLSSSLISLFYYINVFMFSQQPKKISLMAPMKLYDTIPATTSLMILPLFILVV